MKKGYHSMPDGSMMKGSKHSAPDKKKKKSSLLNREARSYTV